MCLCTFLKLKIKKELPKKKKKRGFVIFLLSFWKGNNCVREQKVLGNKNCEEIKTVRIITCLHWTNFWQPTVHVHQHSFEKTLIKVYSLHLYASFGAFCVKIGKLVAAQWVFKHYEEFRNRLHFPSITAICRFLNILQRLAVSRMIDQFRRKRRPKEA